MEQPLAMLFVVNCKVSVITREGDSGTQGNTRELLLRYNSLDDEFVHWTNHRGSNNWQKYKQWTRSFA